MKNLVDSQDKYENIQELCNSERQLKEHLRKILSDHKPKKYIYSNVKSRPAAVLIPIFFKQNQAHILFTKRTDYVEHHKGQISFPGGSRDKTDACLQITALRETEEEVGIKSEHIEILGQTDVFLTNTHFLITPFVGIYNFPYDYKICKSEIDTLIEAPLAHFINDDVFEIKPYERNGFCWQVHYYSFNNEMVWGVTGFLLSNFLSIAFGLDRNIIEISPAEN